MRSSADASNASRDSQTSTAYIASPSWATQWKTRPGGPVPLRWRPAFCSIWSYCSSVAFGNRTSTATAIDAPRFPGLGPRAYYHLLSECRDAITRRNGRRGLPARNESRIATHELDEVSFGTADEERAPPDPIEDLGADSETRSFKPPLLCLVVCDVDREGEMVKRRCFCSHVATSVEQSQNRRVPAVPLGDPEEDHVREPAHGLEAHDVLVKVLHPIKVVHP